MKTTTNIIVLLSIITIAGRYIEIAVRLLETGRHRKWKAELHEKKLTYLAFDTVHPVV